jgi:hypothetical protein
MSVDVRTALHQAGMLTDGTESLIDALDEGTGCDIPVTEEQYKQLLWEGEAARTRLRWHGSFRLPPQKATPDVIAAPLCRFCKRIIVKHDYQSLSSSNRDNIVDPLSVAITGG